jgi:hypothetical protein
VARFLSPEWFAEVAQQSGPRAAPGPEQPIDLVLEQVVRDTPDGEVRYRVVVSGLAAYIDPPATDVTNGTATPPPGTTTQAPPDLTITCDWETATAMAQGRMSSQAALVAGRLRVKGNLARLSGRAGDLVGLDPVPELVRQATTY